MTIQVEEKTIQFTYDFVATGSKVTIDKEKNHFYFDVNGKRRAYGITSTIILDVGNHLTKGVIDVHHLKNGFQWQNERMVSTTKLLTTFPHFLDHIDENSEEVKIIVHDFPDFDCFASVHLAEYYLNYGELPNYANELADYAEEIDSGRKKINSHQVFSPYSITHVLDQTIGSQKFASFKDYQSAYLARGLELINYLAKRLPELAERERSMDSPVLFEEDHLFKMEQLIIEEDFRKYQNDLHMICEKRTLRLPSLEGPAKIVDALFWSSPPSCSLDRLWARGDTTSPSGNGYVFTFVPKPFRTTSENILKRFETESQQIQEIIKTTNQVIISVDGNSDVTLVDLGKMLELEERKIEESIFGREMKEKWRTRNADERRFPEEWCDNVDPWYDGRNNQFQIVDAPRVGSLLSTSKIKEIVINYTKPRIKNYHTKILYPFQFQTSNFQKLCKYLRNNSHYIKQNLMSDTKAIQYFRPYIREYLFYSGDNEKGYSYSFKNDEKFFLKLPNENGKIMSGKRFDGNVDEMTNDVLLEVGNTSIALFRYGIGFVVVETKIISKKNDDDLFFDLLLDINKELCEGKSRDEIINFNKEYLREATLLIQEYEEGLMYSDVTLNASTHFETAKKELLYKLCSQTPWNASFNSDHKHMVHTLNRMYYDINEQTVMGFSKKGSVLVIFEKDTEQMTEEQLSDYRKEIEEERVKFQTWDYFIFLMVVHQRYGFMNFSKELSEIGVKNKFKRVARLRETLYEFIMQGWFSQVTNDERGMDIHRKWVDVLETQTLHDEVLGQVSTIADYQNFKKDVAFSTKFNLVSFFFLIITGVTGFFGMNIPWVDEKATDLHAIWFSVMSFAGVLIFWIIISCTYWLVKKNKGT